MTDQEVEKARGHLLAWLRYHMEDQDLNQQELAERLGVSKGLITQWFSGSGARGLPNFCSLLSISKELDVAIDILIKKNPLSKRP